MSRLRVSDIWTVKMRRNGKIAGDIREEKDLEATIDLLAFSSHNTEHPGFRTLSLQVLMMLVEPYDNIRQRIVRFPEPVERRYL